MVHKPRVRLKVGFKSRALRSGREWSIKKAEMTIGELSKRTGIPSSTLRYWERIKVLPGATRISGQRRYTADTVNLVAILKLAQKCGFSLGEMRRLLHGFEPGTSAAERWRTTIREHREILRQKFRELNAMRRLLDRGEQCQCINLNECGRIAMTHLDRVSNRRKRQ
jgi:MerR family transcriptional regulator, redox-sensitive transcriptional activator SoxR